MRAGVSDNNQQKFIKPTGVAKHSPCYNVQGRRRRRFLNRLIQKLTTPLGRQALLRELRRRIRNSKHWVNEANKYGLESLCELMLAILDDLDLRTWQTRHNLETLAENAGLETFSDRGNKSISRASRGCDRLSWLNLIFTEKAPFNPYDAKCVCKQIEVTEDFFAALGVPLKQVYRERARLLKADPEEVIHSWDQRLIKPRFDNIQRMAGAGMARMKAKREKARELKKSYFTLSPV